MTIEALVRYRVLGDDTLYIEAFSIKYKSNRILGINFCWRNRVLRDIQSRGFIVTEIEDLNVKYIED